MSSVLIFTCWSPLFLGGPARECWYIVHISYGWWKTSCTSLWLSSLSYYSHTGFYTSQVFIAGFLPSIPANSQQCHFKYLRSRFRSSVVLFSLPMACQWNTRQLKTVSLLPCAVCFCFFFRLVGLLRLTCHECWVFTVIQWCWGCKPYVEVVNPTLRL